MDITSNHIINSMTLNESEYNQIILKTLKENNVENSCEFKILSKNLQRRENTSGYLGDYYQLEIVIEKLSVRNIK